MYNALGPGTMLGYCTNVHAGADLPQILANLQRHTLAVKEKISPDAPMGVGLWFSAAAARDLLQQQGVLRLKERLDEWELIPFTCNGFPYGDFHEPVVKHRVYQPDWAHSDRLGYTLNLAVILAELTLPGGEASISTLPIGWRGAPCPAVDHAAAVANLQHLARELARIENETCALIHVDLEPEPGCILQRSDDVVRFFQEHLFRGVSASEERMIRRHIRVCHDICHAAVMFEGPTAALSRYQAAGISVGKVQISAALAVDFEALAAEDRVAAVQALRDFSEPRYLHQTTVRPVDRELMEYVDLPEALHAEAAQGRWRVHFHVPVFLRDIGLLGTTQAEIQPCVQLARALGVCHFEAETYAWSVLPEKLRVGELSTGIAQELAWIKAHIAETRV